MTTLDSAENAPLASPTNSAAATPLAEVPRQLLVKPTTLPDRGVRLGPAHQLSLRGDDADFRQLREISTDGNLLVAVSMTNTQGLGSTIVAIDLTTGMQQRLTKYGPPRISYLYISDQRVVWSEEISPTVPNQLTETLHVYDLNTQTESTVAQDYFQRLHYKHGVATWSGEQNKVRGIYGYNFNSGRLFLIEAATFAHIPLFPRVCNQEWIIYFLTTDYESSDATLHARNLTTGQDLQLGAVTLPHDLDYTLTPHDCEGENVVWLERPISFLTQSLTTQIKFYKLMTHVEQSVKLPGAIDAVKLNGDLLDTDGLGYDLVRQVPFDVKASPVTRIATAGYTPSVALLGNGRWVQLQESNDGRPAIYIADVVRRS